MGPIHDEDEDYRACYDYLAYAYYYIKSYSYALDCAKKAIELTDDDSLLGGYYELIGDIYYDMNQDENAVFAYKKALSIGYFNYNVYEKLGREFKHKVQLSYHTLLAA